jgi:hypothetical protein
LSWSASFSASAQPGQQVGCIKDALRRLGDRLHYLNSGNNRFWFDTRPNLRREMEERKRRFQDKEDVFPPSATACSVALPPVCSAASMFSLASGDVPDDWQLRLVVLPPDAAFSRSGQSLGHRTRQRDSEEPWRSAALQAEPLDLPGRRLRQREPPEGSGALDLAWQSIVRRHQGDEAQPRPVPGRAGQQEPGRCQRGVRRMIRETYKWMLAPMQEARPGQGSVRGSMGALPGQPGAQNLSQEIERVLKENELLITEWAPIHLAKVLKTWFWKDDVQGGQRAECVAAELPAALPASLKDDGLSRRHDGRRRREPRFLRLRAGQGGWPLRRLQLRQEARRCSSTRRCC